MWTKIPTLITVSILTITTLADSAPRPQATGTGAASTAKTVGTAVGTGINAVLSAAFPAAATIINAIWGSKTTDRKNASQAAPPLTQLQKDSAAQIQKLSTDLDTVNVFLVDCVMADRSVIKMQDFLGKKSTLSKDDKDNLQHNWNDASPRITELGTPASKASASSVSDEYIKRSLKAISETNYGDLKNIQDDITNANAEDLRDRLATLEPKLAGITALSGDIIAEVSAGLHTGAKNMAPPQGPEEQQEKVFAKRISDSKDAYEQTMKEVYGVAPRSPQQ